MSKVRYIVKVDNKVKISNTILRIEGFPSIRKFVVNYLPNSTKVRIHSTEKIVATDELLFTIMKHANPRIPLLEVEIISSPYSFSRLLSNIKVFSSIMNYLGFLSRDYYCSRYVRVES